MISENEHASIETNVEVTNITYFFSDLVLMSGIHLHSFRLPLMTLLPVELPQLQSLQVFYDNI